MGKRVIRGSKIVSHCENRNKKITPAKKSLAERILLTSDKDIFNNKAYSMLHLPVQQIARFY
jgi:hypothetical protein